MKKKVDSLLEFVPRLSKPKDSNYVMVRFTKAPELREFLVVRVNGLGIGKEAYVLALIAKDKKESEEG